MQNILNQEALSNLLLRNWTSFIDKNGLVTFILQQARDATFPIIDRPANFTAASNPTFTLSRADLTKKGILLWIEFSIPSDQQIKIGTCEAILSPNGTIQPTNIIGQVIR